MKCSVTVKDSYRPVIIGFVQYQHSSVQKKNLILRKQDNCFNANGRTLDYYRVNRSQWTFPFVLLNRLLISQLCFDSELFITFLVGIFFEGIREET